MNYEAHAWFISMTIVQVYHSVSQYGYYQVYLPLSNLCVVITTTIIYDKPWNILSTNIQ